MNLRSTDQTFDELCEKIAQGKANTIEIAAAFQSLNNDIDAFVEDTQKQLKNHS